MKPEYHFNSQTAKEAPLGYMCMYPKGVNYQGSLVLLLEYFWILKCAKIQIFTYTIISATLTF